MRYTLGDVARRPTRIGEWWYELPWRRRPLRALRTLLFEPGRGWLRWGFDDVWTRRDEPPAVVAPPLRRAWLWVEGPLTWVLAGGGWHRIDGVGPDDSPEWHRFPFQQHRESWASIHRTLRDEDWPEGYL